MLRTKPARRPDRVHRSDDRELRLSGAYSALPVWTEFMKHAVESPSYQDAKPFEAPEGVSTATLDTRTNLVANAGAPSTRDEVLIQGTEPLAASPAGSGGLGGILGRIFQVNKAAATPPAAPALPLPAGAPPPSIGAAPAANAVPEAPPAKKQDGLVRKFLSIFKRKEAPPPSPPPPPKKSATKGE